MMVYPHVHSLDETSELGVFVQSLIDGDEENLQTSSLVVTDVGFSDLVQELSKIYDASEFNNLLEDMSQWRESVSRQEEPALTQWNLIGASRIITAENEQIPVSRFFLASFCHLEGVEELSLLGLTKYLFWEIKRDQEWVLPSSSGVNNFLNSLSGSSNNSGDIDTQDLLTQADRKSVV